MIKKSYLISIWFLDENLYTSAKYMTNKILNRTIGGCVTALLNCIFYTHGIKNKKFYNYYFSKQYKDQSIVEFFPFWPVIAKPEFKCYNSVECKWVRKCQEHIQYIKKYLDILLLEYEFRYNKSAKIYDIANWLINFEVNIPSANLDIIVQPWKSINPKYRREIIIDGYRMQFLQYLKNSGNIFEEYKGSKRDIPDFVLKYFKLDLENQADF